MWGGTTRHTQCKHKMVQLTVIRWSWPDHFKKEQLIGVFVSERLGNMFLMLFSHKFSLLYFTHIFWRCFAWEIFGFLASKTLHIELDYFVWTGVWGYFWIVYFLKIWSWQKIVNIIFTKMWKSFNTITNL